MLSVRYDQTSSTSAKLTMAFKTIVIMSLVVVVLLATIPQYTSAYSSVTRKFLKNGGKKRKTITKVRVENSIEILNPLWPFAAVKMF